MQCMYTLNWHYCTHNIPLALSRSWTFSCNILIFLSYKVQIIESLPITVMAFTFNYLMLKRHMVTEGWKHRSETSHCISYQKLEKEIYSQKDLNDLLLKLILVITGLHKQTQRFKFDSAILRPASLFYGAPSPPYSWPGLDLY
jgi:hypothetical protein